MADFYRDTRVTEVDAPHDGRRFRGQLSEAWSVWGPNGGHLGALALRAGLQASRFDRPVSFHASYLAVGGFGPVDIDVSVLGGGKRADALRADVSQDGRLLLAATVWTLDDGLEGYEHDHAAFPEVPAPETLRGFQDLVDDYDSWYPIWRSMEGRPTKWVDEPGPPVSRTWLRLTDSAMPSDPNEARHADAARQVYWLDYPGWNATIARHRWPHRFLTPNLDLTVQFHRAAPGDEWTLADGTVAVAEGGLVGCVSRLWTADGRLLATGTTHHTCRPNPGYEAALAEYERLENAGPST